MKRRIFIESSKYGLLVPVFLLAAIETRADIVQFSLEGAAGSGITAANEPGDTGNGSGDLVMNSVYDTDTNSLSLNVLWGSSNGFNDLTSNASLVNLHYVESGLPPDVFQQSGPAFFTLNGVDQSPSSGGFDGSITIPEEREQDLLLGRVYLHIHTDNNSGGEARGYFIAQNVVPEPGSSAVVCVFCMGFFVRCRRRR